MLALAHGQTHEHLARRHTPVESPSVADHHHEFHGDDRVAGVETTALLHESAVRETGDDHAHAHPRLDIVAGTRDLIRLPAAHGPIANIPLAIAIQTARWNVAPTVGADRARLARPGPERGPPPTLRAPPTR